MLSFEIALNAAVGAPTNADFRHMPGWHSKQDACPCSFEPLAKHGGCPQTVREVRVTMRSETLAMLIPPPQLRQAINALIR